MDIVGKKLRRYRKNKKITLKELSEMTDLSVSFISQVERNECSLTITSLKKIADALDVKMSEVFEMEENDSYVHNKENQVLLTLESMYTSHIRLSGKFENRKLEAVIIRLEPNSTDITPFTHEGEEFFYVTKGTGEFIIDGKSYVVKAGETIHYPSTIPHALRNPFEEELEVVSVLTPTIF